MHCLCFLYGIITSLKKQNKKYIIDISINYFMKNISNNISNHSKEISKRGFIEIIVVIIVALVLLNLIGIDLKSVLAKESVKQFFGYVKDMCVLVWNDLKMITEFIKNLANN